MAAGAAFEALVLTIFQLFCSALSRPLRRKKEDAFPAILPPKFNIRRMRIDTDPTHKMATEAIISGELFSLSDQQSKILAVFADVGAIYKRLFHHRPVIQNEVHLFVREFEVFTIS